MEEGPGRGRKPPARWLDVRKPRSAALLVLLLALPIALCARLVNDLGAPGWTLASLFLGTNALLCVSLAAVFGVRRFRVVLMFTVATATELFLWVSRLDNSYVSKAALVGVFCLVTWGVVYRVGVRRRRRR